MLSNNQPAIPFYDETGEVATGYELAVEAMVSAPNGTKAATEVAVAALIDCIADCTPAQTQSLLNGFVWCLLDVGFAK